MAYQAVVEEKGSYVGREDRSVLSEFVAWGRPGLCSSALAPRLPSLADIHKAGAPDFGHASLGLVGDDYMVVLRVWAGMPIFVETTWLVAVPQRAALIAGPAGM